MRDLQQEAVKTFVAFLDEFGLLSDRMNKRVTGNGVLYSAHMLDILARWDALSPAFSEKLRKTFESCLSPEHILMRTPKNQFGMESVDNYVGLGMACKVMGWEDLAGKVVRAAGSKVKGPLGLRFTWVMNNLHPGQWDKGAWIGRQRQVVAHMREAAGLRVAWYDRLVWIVTVIGSAFARKTKYENSFLTYGLVYVAERSSPGVLTRFACWFWRNRFESRFPGGLQQVWAEYFGTTNHPLVRW